MKPLGEYQNGNYRVFMLEDGTKIRFNNESKFVPEFAESYDCKITDRCDGGCKWCYEGCTKAGKHADIMNLKFFDTIHPYTELAINGNDLSHPDLIPFLEKMKDQKVIVNMTVNQIHFEKNEELISNLCENKLIYGLGISLVQANDLFLEKVKKYPNLVIHLINGVVSASEMNLLRNHNLKILILGYKELKRGEQWYQENKSDVDQRKEWLRLNLKMLIPDFNVVSFDNLAIKQLEVKNLIPEDEWNRLYMGDDGVFTYYIDAVNETFSKNSTAAETERYPLLENVDDMFKLITGRNE